MVRKCKLPKINNSHEEKKSNFELSQELLLLLLLFTTKIHFISFFKYFFNLYTHRYRYMFNGYVCGIIRTYPDIPIKLSRKKTYIDMLWILSEKDRYFMDTL